MDGNHKMYFDEAYFQRGEERGTAYRDYARSADESMTFREIAEAISFVFRPRKCLEIGCATGAIVRNMNEIGIETYGIDVSQWAIDNKLHDNVVLASANEIPFPDCSFDLVYSSHSLEHIPAALIESALGEINRVSTAQGYQFHMLPIVGTYPYDYDHALARSNLRVDPTHNVLETMEWWRGRWEAFGWHPLYLNVCLSNDTNTAELSSGQFSFSKESDQAELLARAFEWNKLVHRRQFTEIDRLERPMRNPQPLASSADCFSGIIGKGQADWLDFERAFDPPISVENCTVEIAIELMADEVRPLRMALIDDSDPEKRAVLEFWTEFAPGLSTIRVPINRFRRLEGEPNLRRIDKFFFGGQLRGARFRILGTIQDPAGTATPLS